MKRVEQGQEETEDKHEERKSKNEEERKKREKEKKARERLITQKEVDKAIKQLKNDRAAGTDRIIGEVMKEGGDMLRKRYGRCVVRRGEQKRCLGIGCRE